VQATLAPRSPLEVLDGVRQVDLAGVDLGGLQGAGENVPRRADEGFALDVLAVARLLADQHQLRLPEAGAEDRLRRVPPQRGSHGSRRRHDGAWRASGWRDELGGGNRLSGHPRGYPLLPVERLRIK
jgi:hypothetical protein